MKPVEIDHFQQYRHPYRLRAKGGKLAFLLKQPSVADNCYHSDLWLLKDGQPLPLTTSGDIQKFWWKDADTLVFPRPASEDDKQLAAQGLPLTVLQTLALSTPGEAQPFLRLAYDVDDLVFLPDGRLLFTALYDKTKSDGIAAAPDEKTAAEQLQRQKDVEVLTELPFWSNGDGFQSGRRCRLYLYDAGTVTPLTDEKTDVEQLRLSPEGDFACFVARRFETRAPLEDRLYCLPLSTLSPQNLTFSSTFSHAAYTFADNDTLVVFGTDHKAYGLNQNGAFFRLSLSSGTAQPLYASGAYSGWESVTTDLKHSEKSPMALCGGSALWLSSLEESSHLFSIDPDTGDIFQLTAAPGATTEFAIDDDIVYIAAMRGLAGSEIYVLQPDGTEIPLTNFNTVLADEYSFSTPEPFSFTNGEGNEIRGYALPPLPLSREQSYPSILCIHGGPKAVFGPVLFHELQYLSACGFGVLFCNPTGSDGRGDAFSDIRGRYGLVDYDDLMGFLDAAIENFSWVDPARLGVSGGSYGGYMVNWIIGHTGRFSAAVSQRGIASWLSMTTTSDIGYTFVPDQAGATPWEDFTALWEQSPLKYAGNVSTPTLFLHSEEDYRCPLSEGLQMYAALQQFGTETRLCLFRGENHELSRSGKPQNRVRRLQELSTWFRQHLQP